MTNTPESDTMKDNQMKQAEETPLSKTVDIKGETFWALDVWAFDVATSIRNAKTLDEAAQMARNVADNIRKQQAKLTTSQVSEPDEDEIYAMIGKIGMSESRPIGQQWDSVITLVRHFAKPTTTPQEAISPAIAEYSMKDHEIRELVNKLTVIAKEYAQTQQLRARISRCVLEAIEASKPTGLE